MRRAYLVTGAESSGTCYLTQLLIDAGCSGKAGGTQPNDGPRYGVFIQENAPAYLALQRSIPHAQVWVDIRGIVNDLRDAGYYVTILVLARDQYCQEQSQKKDGHAKSRKQFTLNVSTAWREVFSVILGCGVEFHVVPYAALGDSHYRRWLVDTLELPGAFRTPFQDGDAKYLEVVS